MTLNKSKKQILLLYSSTIGGVLLGILVSILNTRSLNPSDYGDVRYVNNIIAFFSGVFLFGYFVSGSRLLAIAPTKKEANRIKGIMVLILVLTIILMMLTMLICGFIHDSIFHKNFSNLFFYVIPVCGCTLLLNYINTSSQGDNSIKTIAAARILPQLVYLFIAYISYQIWGATSERMLLLQNGITTLVLGFLILKNSPDFRQIRISFRKLQIENKQYGLQVYWGSLANVSVQYIAGISLGIFSIDNVNVGFYTLALTITTPLMMLPNVIGTTYFKQFANQKYISLNILQGTYIMSFISLIGFCILIHPIVNYLYSKSYESVATYSSFLAVGYTLHGLGDVYNRFLGAHGKGKYLRNGAFLSGGIAIIGYTIGIYYSGITAAISTRILSSTVYFIMMIYYYHKFKSISSNSPIRLL